MLVISCGGGLGNQMFQYAFYLNQKYNIKENVKFDLSWFNDNHIHNGYELERVFNIKVDYATIDDLKVSGKPISVIDKIKNKIFINKQYYANRNPKEAIMYLPKIVERRKGYLFGCWQSEKYFINHAKEVREAFVFKLPLDNKNKKIKEKILSENSISIHIRRGDYLKNENSIFQNICTLNYYKNSIEYIEKNISNPSYYIFSNDIEWCKKIFNIKNVTYVDWNNGNDSYKDMQLMSYCKHNIIANSSFSWWGAWLNNNSQKIVCVPERWFDLDGCGTNDIAPAEWKRIKI